MRCTRGVELSVEHLDLSGRLTGPGHPPYVIAEIGANHNGDMDLCRQMIREAARCGADAVKFQSWTAESLISSAEYGRNAAYNDPERHFGSLKEMVERYQLSAAQHREVAAYCREEGVHFMSTPFSPAEVDLLAELGVPALKIASMDVTHPELLKYAAQTGLPIILSTGMASLAEVGAALGRQRGGHADHGDLGAVEDRLDEGRDEAARDHVGHVGVAEVVDVGADAVQAVDHRGRHV